MNNTVTRASGVVASKSRKKIVVLEDHNDARQMLGIALTKMGFEVFSASRGGAGLALVREHQPFMVLLDITLDDALDGLAVCEKIKESAAGKSTRVVIMSGRKEQAVWDEAKRVGASAFLVKPFRLSRLLEIASAERLPEADFFVEVVR